MCAVGSSYSRIGTASSKSCTNNTLVAHIGSARIHSVGMLVVCIDTGTDDIDDAQYTDTKDAEH